MPEETHSDFSLSNPFAAPEHDADPPADPEPEEPVPASMAMTKAELLDRLHEHEEGLTKAEILERIKKFEHGDDAPAEDVPPPAPPDTTTRSATIDGRTLTWTDATAHQVPEEYVRVEQRSRGMSV